MATAGNRVLEAARVQAGLSVSELWMAYFALGGSETAGVLRAFLDADVDPGLVDFDVLVQALNEKFMDLGGDHPVPYEEEISR
jgi:hypothetical protein